ncbi:MAG TPA: T9SS type A sorting domain-containing protein [Rubricoccaceae bacterium]|nr:T9SS type A sorting domain-containing protein [Rubricoccaceae bacterium]
MHRSLPLVLAALLVPVWGTAALAQDAAPLVVSASRVNTSAPIRDLPIRPGSHRSVVYAIPNKFHKFDQQSVPDVPAGFVDPVLDTGAAESGGGSVLLSFEGVSEDDNAAVASVVVPPDANGDVGPNHYVQWVNLAAKIFDKDGNLLLGPVPGNHFFQGLGGQCETRNDGDPVTLYDHLADRWVVMQFQISVGNDLCVAVSATPDPTGAYHQYEFSFAQFPDYPKMGVWPDGYYATTRVFGGGFTGQQAIAFEREAMLDGDPAQMIIFNIPGGSSVDGFLPADLDGPPPPPGTPGLFVGSPSTPASFKVYGLHADWTTPANSTFTLLDTFTPAPYDGSIGSIPQPSPGEGLATLSFAIMHRVQYRNFGSHQTMVLNHTVDAGGDRAGIRWYELRDTGSGWGIHQQGTYAPSDGHERWMGSIAMNGNGDIALGYSVSSGTLFPSIRFTGQTADQSGTGVMNVAETEIHAGTGAQFGSFGRWGDYSMISVDPSDDTSFWYTTEYYQTTSSFNFRTRIAKVALPGVVGCEQTLAATLDDDTPAPGQTITFAVTVTNNAASPAPLDLWLVADGPVDRTVRLGGGTVPAGATVTRNVPLRIPGNTPSGTYALDLNIGDYPDDVCDTAAFTLNVSAPLAGTPSDASALFEVVEAADLSAGEAAGPVAASAAAGSGAVLEAAHPNPFFAATTLAFTLPEATEVTVGVFDMLGRRVAVLQDGYLGAGRHAVAFDASRLPSGPYLVRLVTAGGAAATQRVTLVR